MIANLKHTLTRISRLAIIAVSVVMLAIPQPLLAQGSPTTPTPTPTPSATTPQIDYSANDIDWYDPRGNNVCGVSGGGAVSGDTVARFLQVLAEQESGGNIHAISGTGATGKYQYIDSTWKASAQSYYPPALQYAEATNAPEPVQDAVAYIEYTSKFKQFNNNVFKLAVSHFYPLANTDPRYLDIIPPGNVITPRQYANQIIQKLSSGAGKNIPITASQAPDFQKYLAQNGGGGSGSGSAGSSGGGQTCTGGVVSGDIVKTALGLAWPTPGHGKNQGDATPAYQSAMPKYNGATFDDPWSDCGVFVATVMVSSGADSQYQRRGTSAQIDYIKQHPTKFDFFTTPDYTDSTAKLQPGDIMISYGHTYIFTGVYKGSDGKIYNSASASLHDHVPQATNWYAGFFVARKK